MNYYDEQEVDEIKDLNVVNIMTVSVKSLDSLLMSTSFNSFSFKYATYAFDGSLPNFANPIGNHCKNCDVKKICRYYDGE